MKYRRLTNKELEQLEDKFIQFLVSNTVTANDWVKIKEKDISKAESLIGLFSDIVFEEVLQKVEYLEFRSANDLKIFHCQKDKMTLRGLRVQQGHEINFQKNNSADKIIDTIENDSQAFHIYEAEKAYAQNRENELFKMMEQGCLISKDEKLFKALESSSSNR